MRLPSELETAVEAVASEVGAGALARAARELSERYKRADFSGPALRTPNERAAYLQVRLPATFAANRHVFREVRNRLPNIQVESMLDLGAGPGTSMWAAVEAFPEITKITLAERDRDMAAIGRSLAARSMHAAVRAAEWKVEDVAGGVSAGAYDLVVMSYALGEFGQTGATLVANAWRAAKTLLVIIEPGTPRNFQTVLLARETLIAAGAQIVAPCPHHKECPLAEDDWCHFAERLERTAVHRRLKGGDLGYEDEKFSYVVGSRECPEWPYGRIVRHPLYRTGHVQLTLCTADGLRQVTVGKSDKEKYRVARKVRWGEVW